MPIVCTGNDFSTLYAPLIRDGRMEKVQSVGAGGWTCQGWAGHATQTHVPKFASSKRVCWCDPALHVAHWLLHPLSSPGAQYYWNPTREDRIGVCMGIFQVKLQLAHCLHSFACGAGMQLLPCPACLLPRSKLLTSCAPRPPLNIPARSMTT